MLRRAGNSIISKAAMSTAPSVSIPATQKVVLINDIGDFDVIKYQDYPVPTISDDELLIKNKYAGVNYIESYFRKGIYPSEKPYLLGREATGVVVAKGDSVKGYDIGDKVGYVSGATFAQYTKFSVNGRILKVPKDSDDEKLKLYAAALLQGLTALTFVHEAYDVKPDDYILLYAAAGGVGLIFDQLVKLRGAHTIAVASTDEKLILAKKFGAEFGINSSKEDILSKVQDITNGKGVAAVFDSVGKDTFETSLAALKNKGTFVSFGNASGPVTPFPLSKLSPKNIKLLRPQLNAYTSVSEGDWEKYSKKLLELVDSNSLKILIHKTYPLSEYKEAAQELESRKTTGRIVLEIPQ